MSTKTTIKRIALVAVSALGLGMVTTVAANATAGSLTTEYVTAISASNATVPVAGSAGAAVITTVTFKSSTTSTSVEALPTALLISKPATSAMAYETADGTVAAGKFEFATTSGGSTNTTAANLALSATDSTGEVVNRAADGTANSFRKVYLNANYDVAGTYKYVFFDDLNASGTIDGNEFSYVWTVVVADGSAAITATSAAHNSTSGAGSTYGSLVKISLKDAAGNAANVDSAGGVKVTVSGSGQVAYVNGSSVTAASTYVIGRTSFNGSGNAWINVTDASAEVVAVTLSGVGSTTVSGGSVNLTFVSTAGATSGQVSAGATYPNIGAIASNAANAKVGSTVYLQTGATLVAASATHDKDDVNVTDTAGTITGKAGVSYSLAIATGTTGDDYSGAFSIATGTTAAGQTFAVQINSGTAVTFTSAAQSHTSGAVKTLISGATSYSAAATLTSVKLATITVTVKAYDQFSGAYANTTITPSFSSSSRNYGQVLSTIVTGSAGTATFSFTDANTSASTTATSDVISFSDGTNTGTLTITYAADADYGVSTMVIDSNDTDSTGATLPASSITPVAISTGDGAEGATGDTVSVTLKNSAGTLLSGVPVVWSISGTGAALALPTGLTSFSSAGVASATVYAWLTGTYTITAKAGSKSVSAPVTFASTTATNARVISATTSGSNATALVTDRFGNPVKNVTVTAATTSGYFGSGTTTASGTTAADGTVTFVLIGSGTVTVSIDPATYGQAIAAKGSSDYDAANTYTETTAATATAAASGIGASYAPAGVKSASVDVTGTATSDSIDAANEATDAANAATDAANAAAEAADAATALATSVASLIAGIKAQITTLTNLVIKIQKKVRA
jgi:hypothetical protein